MTDILRLSDILARGVTVEWFEGVALVREVADRVRDSVGGRGVPELDQVQLAFDGTVSITGATRTATRAVASPGSIRRPRRASGNPRRLSKSSSRAVP